VSVTVVTGVRARPGGEAALIAAAVRSFQAPAAGEVGDAPPRLFQGYDDPERFYWVTHWANRELYLAGVPAGAAEDWLHEVCADTLERAFFTPLDAPNREPAGTVWGGALVALGSGSGAARTAGDHLIGHLCAEPAMTGVGLYQGLDDPSQYLVLFGWETEDARQRFYAESLPRYEAAIRGPGGRVDSFVERTLADVDGYPRESDAARPPIRAGRTPTD
jgi:heme-degrading monooxygenase HmoA